MDECEPRYAACVDADDGALHEVIERAGLSRTITHWLVSQLASEVDGNEGKRRFDSLFWRVTVELFCSMQERLDDEQVCAFLSFINKHPDADKLSATALLIDLAPSLHSELVASLADRLTDILVVESREVHDIRLIHDQLVRLSDTLMTVHGAIVV